MMSRSAWKKLRRFFLPEGERLRFPDGAAFYDLVRWEEVKIEPLEKPDDEEAPPQHTTGSDATEW